MKENLYAITAAIAYRFSFIWKKLRNTDKQIFYTAPRHVPSQECTHFYWYYSSVLKRFLVDVCRGSALLTHIVRETNNRRVPGFSLEGIEPRFLVVFDGGNRTHILSGPYLCWYKGKPLFQNRSLII